MTRSLFLHCICYALFPGKVIPLPAKIGPSKAREEYSTLLGFQKDVQMYSYVPKKGKTVFLLFSIYFDAIVSDGTRKEPEFINYFNSTKNYVGMMGRMFGDYSSTNK